MIGANFESREPMIYRGFTIAISVILGGLIWSTNVDPSNAIDIESPTENISPIITTSSSPQKVKFAKFLSENNIVMYSCLLYTSPSPRDLYRSRMPSSA